MSRKIFSIDIQDTGIAAVLVENSLKGNWIQSQRFVPYPEGGQDSGGGDDPVTEALKKVFEDIGPAGLEVIVSVPSRWVSYRNLQVPFKDAKKIRQVLPFELEPTLPYPIESLKFDAQTIFQAEKTDVLVGLIPEPELMKLLSTLKSLEIDPRMVMPAGLPLAVCLATYLETGEDLIFINNDHSCATIFAVGSGRVLVARSFFSSSPAPQAKAKRLVEASSQVMGAIETLFATGFEPVRALVSGPGLDFACLQGEMRQGLDIPVTQVDLIHDLDLTIRPVAGLELDADRMNTALGLAAVEILGLPAINFYGSRSIIKKLWEEYKNDFIRTGVMAVLVLVTALFNVLLEAHFLQKEVHQLNQQIAFIFQSTFPDTAKIIDPLQQMRSRVQEAQKKGLFTGEMDNEMRNIDILNEISTRIPGDQDVEITNFVRGDSSLLVTGNTDSFNTVDDIKVRLSQAEGLKNITINSANLEKMTNRIQFKLKIDL